jgi:hypothetical protein
MMPPLAFPGRVTIAIPLVPLADMKAHLRITDTAHDADVTAISAAAQDAILAYLTGAADPTWTDATAPRAVVHAIKIFATHLYEHRGDDMDPSTSGATPDAAVWAAIERLLGRHRDPTLA